MLVYGDPQYEVKVTALVAHLRARLAAVTATPDSTLDELRTLLILAGQLEQAAHDSLAESLPAEEMGSQVARFRAATAHAATAFYRTWAAGNGTMPATQADVHGALALMAAALEIVTSEANRELTVKLPEGFAFYALYPEQYCAAAGRWLDEHATVTSRQAVVVGVRSIGTTLAAVVTAALAAAGWQVHSLTVRPTGHPFARQVAMRPEEIAGASWGLVVDEGPGLSGSSMAAVAEALVEVGLERARISFLPAHGGAPGSAASERVRAWWTSAPRYVTPLSDIRFDGRPLPDALAVAVADLWDADDPVVQIEDVGGGQWRTVVYADPSAWPAVCAPFERPKYRCVTRSGASVLLKFEGLAGAPGGVTTAEAALAQLAARAQAGWGPAPLGVVHGFVAIRWVEGVPLTRADAEPALLAHIGRYLAHVAGSPLAAAQQDAAVARLREMLYWNTWEALGEPAAVRAQQRAEAAVRAGLAGTPRRYGDGHLAPHEWLRTPAGQSLKVDGTGHDADHTMIGPQAVAWDLAGAMVDWGLDMAAAAPLLAAFQEAGGEPVPPAVLRFYRVAYAAFRAGQTSMCAAMSAHDPDEQERLWRAYHEYRAVLERLLDSDEPES